VSLCYDQLYLYYPTAFSICSLGHLLKTTALSIWCKLSALHNSRTYSVVQLDTLRTIAYAVLSGIGVRSMNPVFCSKLVKQYEICAAGTRRNRLEVFAPAQRSIPSPCLTPRFCVVLSFLEDVDDKTVQEEVRSLNGNPMVHGIILQLPLPAHLDAALLMSGIKPVKVLPSPSPRQVLFELLIYTRRRGAATYALRFAPRHAGSFVYAVASIVAACCH